MKEIKFRVWDIEEKKWIEWEDIRNMAFATMMHKKVEGAEFSYYAFYQYIGVTDKHLKECYAGHIIKTEEGEVGLVEWCDDPEHLAWTVRYTSSDGFCRELDLPFCGDFEIIGDIRLTPELIA